MINDTLKNKIRTMVLRVLGRLQSEVGDQDDLFALGLDSITTMMLISELEEHFGIDLSGEDLAFENFSSIDRMSRFIGALLKPVK